MLTLKKVAVTGGLASGKTSVCNYLKKNGAYVVSADEIVHQLLTIDTAVQKKIIAVLGFNCVKEGKIDRKWLAKLVFSDPNKLKKLEEILHPAVLEEIEREYERVKNQKTYSLFAAEVPLLYECAWESHFDHVIVVVSEEDLCKKRVWKTTDDHAIDYDLRMARQLPMKEKLKRSDLRVMNNGSLKDLENQIEKMIPQLKL